MCQEPTESLWIGCLTGLIWTQKFKSVTLTPNTNSQTCWLKGVSRVTNGTIFFICAISAISPFQLHLLHQEFQLDKLLRNDGEEDAGTEGEERVVSKSRPAAMNFFHNDKFFHRIESDCIWKSGDADGFGETRQQDEYWTKPIRRSVDAASTSQVRLKDAYLGGFMEKQRWNPSHREEEDSEDSDNPEAEIWYYKLVAQNSKGYRQPLAHGASSSVDKESQKDTETTWDHYLRISPNTSHYVEAVLSMVRKIYGRQPGDPVKDLNVNLALWGMLWIHSSSSGSSRKLLWHEFKICKETSLGNCGTAFQGNRKASQRSDRNRWHEHD